MGLLSVELSDAARRLTEEPRVASEERAPLSAERLARVSKRLHDGFYDGQAVRHTIASRVLPDLLA